MEELLRKYIAHVIYYEGIDFIDRCNIDPENVLFTDEEVKKLEELSS